MKTNMPKIRKSVDRGVEPWRQDKLTECKNCGRRFFSNQKQVQNKICNCGATI